MKSCVLKAYAKINLGLDVIGVLPNGYHEVKMLMQTIDLYDELSIEKTDSDNGYTIDLTTDSGELTDVEGNLVYKAAKLMMDTYSLTGHIKMHLTKKIPIAAGMAGGSTDAAAAIKGINLLYELNRSTEELMALSVKIGADVPYCIMGGTALAEGIGEKLTALPPAPACHVIIAKPDINVSTKYVYEHLDSEGVAVHPDIDGIVDSIKAGDLFGITSRLENVLETVTVPAYPVISDIREKLLENGADGARMSGSGPTVFGIFSDLETAKKAFARAKEENWAKHLFLTTLKN